MASVSLSPHLPRCSDAVVFLHVIRKCNALNRRKVTLFGVMRTAAWGASQTSGVARGLMQSRACGPALLASWVRTCLMPRSPAPSPGRRVTLVLPARIPGTQCLLLSRSPSLEPWANQHGAEWPPKRDGQEPPDGWMFLESRTVGVLSGEAQTQKVPEGALPGAGNPLPPLQGGGHGSPAPSHSSAVTAPRGLITPGTETARHLLL